METEIEMGALKLSIHEHGEGFLTAGDYWQRLYKDDVIALKAFFAQLETIDGVAPDCK